MWYDVEYMDRRDAVLIIRQEHDGSDEWWINCGKQNTWNSPTEENDYINCLNNYHDLAGEIKYIIVVSLSKQFQMLL